MKIKKFTKSPGAYVVVVLILIGIIYLVANKESGKGQYDDFAKYLTGQEVVMYGAEWCTHCKNQKKMFGASFQYVDYFECDVRGKNPRTKECLDAGVRGYPTWEIKGELYPGEQSFETLSALTGCSIN